MDATISARAMWESLYVIVGSSGGALIGLQSVVVTLLADRRHGTTAGALNAFASPTVVHLTGALAVSAIMSAPWRSPGGALHRPRRNGSRRIGVRGHCRCADPAPKTVRPRVAGLVVVHGAACCMLRRPAITGFLRANTPSLLFVIATSALSLLLIGIHNAWDTVTHIVLSNSDGNRRKD
jgi:hypothetical protein